MAITTAGTSVGETCWNRNSPMPPHTSSTPTSSRTRAWVLLPPRKPETPVFAPSRHLRRCASSASRQTSAAPPMPTVIGTMNQLVSEPLSSEITMKRPTPRASSAMPCWRSLASASGSFSSGGAWPANIQSST